jgi:hypothetical protein
MMAGNARSGAGSPSHDMAASGRLFSKRWVLTLRVRARVWQFATLKTCARLLDIHFPQELMLI